MELAHATCNAVAGNGMGPESAYALRHREPSLSARYESASHANEIHVLPTHTRAPRDEPLVSEKDVGSKWVGIGRLLFGPGPGTNSTTPCSALLPQPRDEAPEVASGELASGELQGCGVDLVVDHPEAKGRFIHGGSGSKETMKAALLQMQQGCM